MKTARIHDTRSVLENIFSEVDVKGTDDGPSIVGGTQLGNVKQSDDGLSVVGSTQRDMSYSEVVSIW